MSYGLRLLAGEPVELCDECGFDAREVVEVVPELVAVAVALDAQRHRPGFDERPEEEVFSGEEYVRHTVDVANELVRLVESTLDRPPTDPADGLPAAATRVQELASTLTAAEWDSPVDMGDDVVIPVGAVLAHLLHDAAHHLWDVRRGLAGLALRDGEEILTVRR